jgi:hypothetical protein
VIIERVRDVDGFPTYKITWSFFITIDRVQCFSLTITPDERNFIGRAVGRWFRKKYERR